MPSNRFEIHDIPVCSPPEDFARGSNFPNPLFNGVHQLPGERRQSIITQRPSVCICYAVVALCAHNCVYAPKYTLASEK